MAGLNTSRLLLPLTIVLSLVNATPAAKPQQAGSYEAVLSDGTRIEGERLVGWHEHPGSPRLDDTALLDARRPMLWLRSKTLGPWSPPDRSSGYIEFFGGDRIVGDIVGAQGSSEDDGLHIPAHLLVKPAMQLNAPSKDKLPPYLRIRSDHIRRVVFHPPSNRRFQGGNLFYVNGQRVRFVNLMWRQESVVLLLSSGTRTVKLPDIAEIHLPAVDPWRGYYRELAILSPACLSRLVRIETTDGLIATASDMRFDATAFTTAVQMQQARHLDQVKAQRDSSPGKDGNADTWCHMVQPAWSLDSLWVPFRSIYMRWSLPPTYVPLSRIQPSASVSPLLLPWHANRNSAARPLRSGRQRYSWGFAVHAYSELSFVLPETARAFRTRLGLDSIVDKGGCVRGRVFVGSTEGKPLYESPLIIGSDRTVDTGSIPLRGETDGSSRLILQADPAARNLPPGADPVNVRDKLDWLDPQIELDLQKLQAAVRRQVIEDTFAWKGWTLRFDKGGLYTWSSFHDKTAGQGRGSFLPMVRAEGKPLTLSRTMTVGPNDNWLVVNTAGLNDGVLNSKVVRCRVNRVEMSPETIPRRWEWQGRDPPRIFSLNSYRGKKVTLEVTQAADGKPVYWKAAGIAEIPPAAYRLSRILKLAGKDNLQVPRGLGWALSSAGVDEQGKLALFDIHRLGGVVNFAVDDEDKLAPDELSNVLIGLAWTGSDKAFIASFGKLSSLKTLLLTGDARVSPDAVNKLQTAMPRLTIVRLDRTPSPVNAKCYVMMHNCTKRNVTVLWVNFRGKLVHPRTIGPGKLRTQQSRVGARYEAYLDGKLISKYAVISNDVWRIRSEN